MGIPCEHCEIGCEGIYVSWLRLRFGSIRCSQCKTKMKRIDWPYEYGWQCPKCKWIAWYDSEKKDEEDEEDKEEDDNEETRR